MRRLLIALATLLALWGAPALAGSITLLGVGKAPATSSAAVPVWAWATSDYIATSSTSATTSKSSNSIASGDLLIILTGQKPNSPSNYALLCPATGGWTGFSWSANYDSSEGWNFLGCWKIAGAGETGAYTVTWTTSSANLSTWALIDITGANASPIDATAITNNAYNGTAAVIVAPTVSSSGSNRLHLSCGAADGSSQNIYSGYPAGYTQKLDASYLSIVKLACATKTVGSGATGTTTWSATLPGSGPGFSILIKP